MWRGESGSAAGFSAAATAALCAENRREVLYASIDHVLLQEQLSKHIQNKGVRRLLWHYMRRCAERGISLGCPLSPLMGALFLQNLDEREQLGLFYSRYMDDIVVLTKLRKAVRAVNQTLNGLRLEKQPEKVG